MENFEMNMNLSNDSEMKQHYLRFTEQLSDWYSNEKTPELAGQDTGFALKLQKEKLQSIGLDVQKQINKSKEGNDAVSSLSYSDNVFVNTNISSDKLITTSIRDSQNEIYSRSAECGLHIVIQNPKQGGIPSPDTAMCCPHCGAPSTLGKLESGCDYCDTKFLMDELYPKVMNFFVYERTKDYYDQKPMKKYILGFSLFFLVVCIAQMIFGAASGKIDFSRLLIEGVGYLFGSVFAGVIFGVGAWFIAGTFGTVKSFGKSARGVGKAGKSLVFCYKMQKIDPTFSTEYFRDKSVSLLKLMLYSKNPQELTVCKCDKPIPEKIREIVDVTYYNSGVDRYSINNGVCDVSVTFYTDDLHYRDGRIYNKSDKIRMSLRKVIKKPTDLGFSVMAVTCPSCGASFDAEKVKNCPLCGNTYPIEENDWVVTDIEI